MFEENRTRISREWSCVGAFHDISFPRVSLSGSRRVACRFLIVNRNINCVCVVVLVLVLVLLCLSFVVVVIVVTLLFFLL